MIRNGACGAFNPELLEQFFRVEPELRKFYQRAPGGEAGAPACPQQPAGTGSKKK